MFGEMFRKHGLGDVVRQVWERERVSPPFEMTNEQVWQWINRSDVAFSMVKFLVTDPRLVILASLALLSPVAEYHGGTVLEIIPATERVVYGIDSDQWVALVERLGDEQTALMKQRSRDGRGTGERIHTPEWTDWAFSGVSHVVGAVGALRQRAPVHVVMPGLTEAVQCGWRGLRDKLERVDLLPTPAAVRVANEVMLLRLRKIITPGVFTAPSQGQRWAE